MRVVVRCVNWPKVEAGHRLVVPKMLGPLNTTACLLLAVMAGRVSMHQQRKPAYLSPVIDPATLNSEVTKATL